LTEIWIILLLLLCSPGAAKRSPGMGVFLSIHKPIRYHYFAYFCSAGPVETETTGKE